MARKNTFETVENLIHSEIEMSQKEILAAVQRFDYVAALSFAKYKDGLIRSLLFIKSCKPKGKTDGKEN